MKSVLVKQCAIPETHSTFDFIGNIASFIKLSRKKNARLIAAIKSVSDRISNKWGLQQPCQTRWTVKHLAVLAVSEMYDPIGQVLLIYDSSVAYQRSQQNCVAKQSLCTLL